MKMKDNEIKDKDEAKSRKKVQDTLNKLISDEWFAGNIYKQFVFMLKPEDRSLLEETLVDVANDELNDHLASLVDFASKNGYEVPASYNDMKKHADLEDVKLFEKCKAGQELSFYIEKSIASEDRAIETYEKYVNDEFFKFNAQGLDLIIRNNYYDEIDHKEKFEFAKSQIEAWHQYNPFN